MFVFVAHCACNCATMQITNSEAFPALEGQCDIYIYRIKFIMLEVRENEISLRKLSGGTAHAQLRGNTGRYLEFDTTNAVKMSYDLKTKFYLILASEMGKTKKNAIAFSNAPVRNKIPSTGRKDQIFKIFSMNTDIYHDVRAKTFPKIRWGYFLTFTC